MNNTFKPITFDRKQRIAFLMLLFAIVLGGIWNIWGVSYDRTQDIEAVDLETAIVEQDNYKRYWRKKRSDNNWGAYHHNQKNYYSQRPNNSNGKRPYRESDQRGMYQSDKEQSTLANARQIFESSRPIDSISIVKVPEDYTEDQPIAEDGEAIADRYELHPFDPNTVTMEELQSMFLPEKWAANLINYRDKGGIFYDKASVKKLYNTTEELYHHIAPFIAINEETLAAQKAKAYEEKNREWLEELKKEGKLIDLNSVNVETLRKLPNISMGVASGIVKYRELLGGYHDINQLSEVYYMTSEVMESLNTYGTLEPLVEYININTASFDQLGKHPYITYKRAKVIKKYLENHGPFTEVEDIIKVGVWNPEQFKKVKVYLVVGDE